MAEPNKAVGMLHMSDSDKCFIMLCNMETEQECINRSLFGDKARRLDLLIEIKPGDIGFLFNVERDELIGVFRACSEVGLHLESDAWKGKFAAQVRVERLGELKRIGDAAYVLAKAGVGMGRLASGMPAPMYPVHGAEVTRSLLAQFDADSSMT